MDNWESTCVVHYQLIWSTFKRKMSVASSDQGCTGIACPRDVIGFCLHLEWEYFKHSSQFNTKFSSWSFNPGQYTVSLPLSCYVASCFLCGTTIQVPFKIIPSPTVSSSLKVKYGCILLGTSLIVLGHPWVRVCLSSANSSSSWVAILIWFKLSLLALNWLVIWCICSFGSLMVSFSLPSQDKQSASWLVIPGIYLTVTLYANVLISIYCNLGVAWFKLFINVSSSSFWSVSSIKWLVYKKNDGTSLLPKPLQTILSLLPLNLSGHWWGFYLQNILVCHLVVNKLQDLWHWHLSAK